ncbi:MAG: chemotaxis protein CheW [Thiobacillaceae bacterium]
MSKNFSLKDFQNQLTHRLQTASKQPATSSRLGFKVSGHNWLVNLADINEVLPVPIILPVPGARSWFRGITNIRGNLYAVSDLGDFLFGRPAQESARNRLLLAHNKLGVNAALLVDQTLGLKHLTQLTAETNASGSRYTAGQYNDTDGISWVELHMATLLADADFMAAEA